MAEVSDDLTAMVPGSNDPFRVRTEGALTMGTRGDNRLPHYRRQFKSETSAGSLQTRHYWWCKVMLGYAPQQPNVVCPNGRGEAATSLHSKHGELAKVVGTQNIHVRFLGGRIVTQ